MKQPKVRYYLERKDKDPKKRIFKELVMAEVNYGYRYVASNGSVRSKPFRISLQASILPRDFGKEDNNFKYDSKVFEKFSKRNRTIKNRMSQLEKAIVELENQYLVESVIPIPKDFKNAVKVKLKRLELVANIDVTILNFLKNKINKDISSLGIVSRKSLSKGTISTYKSLAVHIENYQLATGTILNFSTFDEDKYWDLWRVIDEIFRGVIVIDNSNNSKKKDIESSLGYSSSTIQKYQKKLIVILRLAAKDYTVLLDLGNSNLLLKNSNSQKDFYVSESELKVIIDTDVSYDNLLQRAKNYIILGGLTGMRYQSIEMLYDTVIKECKSQDFTFKYVHSIQNKTGTEVFIPLLKPILDILDDNNGVFPKFPSNQVINSDLKRLFSKLNFNESIDVVKVTYSNGTIKGKKKKSELISTHDLKKSFYSNLYLLNVNQAVIDNICHPDKRPVNSMSKIYNNTDMLDKAKMFYSEIMKINSDVYRF